MRVIVASLLAFGLPMMTAANTAKDAIQRDLAWVLESCARVFETAETDTVFGQNGERLSGQPCSDVEGCEGNGVVYRDSGGAGVKIVLKDKDNFTALCGADLTFRDDIDVRNEAYEEWVEQAVLDGRLKASSEDIFLGCGANGREWSLTRFHIEEMAFDVLGFTAEGAPDCAKGR